MAPLPAPAEKPSHRVSDSQSHAKVRPPTQVAVFCAALWPNLQPALTIEGTKRYAAQVEGKEAEYIKHPSTWLNGQCWLDEQDPPPKANLTWWEKRQLEEERRAELAAGA